LCNQPAVLVVEDEDTLRILLQTVLEDNGIKVLTARDGLDAMDVFNEHKDEIGILLSDMGLPHLGGWDAYLMMKKIKPELKGILASGYLDEDLRSDLIKAGAREFVQKPYNTQAIVALINEIFREDEKK
jgi:two-component system cell cycle sensor histidine kinase/response regulator CckA